MITENEAKDWFNHYMSLKEFIEIGKERGYIEKSAIDEVKKYWHECQQLRKTFFPNNIFLHFVHLEALWEKAYKELEEEKIDN